MGSFVADVHAWGGRDHVTLEEYYYICMSTGIRFANISVITLAIYMFMCILRIKGMFEYSQIICLLLAHIYESWRTEFPFGDDCN